MLKSRFIVVCEPIRFEMMSLTDIATEAMAFANGDKNLEIEYVRAALRKQRLIRTDSLEYEAMESEQAAHAGNGLSTASA